MKVRLVIVRNLKCCRFDFHIITLTEQDPQGRRDAASRQQIRPAGGIRTVAPEWRTFRHVYLDRTASEKGWHRARRSLWCGPKRPPIALKSRIPIVKVIASSLRKGNIVDLDGKLYVVLNAESFHPGKGTPTTQIDMRRISDGVKVAQRYKTTEQVERAHVEDREYSYLYQDGDGFHFMNTQNYDQVTLQADMVGDQAAYLAPEMKVTLAVYENVPVSIELPQKTVLEVMETEPTIKSQ